VLGIDVARFGDDMSVIYPRKGLDCRTHLPMKFRNIPLDRLEDRIMAINVPRDPVIVVEAILKLSLRMQRITEHAPNHLGVAVGRDRHHSLPDDAVDRGEKREPVSDIDIGVLDSLKVLDPQTAD
jgi:hypothetical protein